MSRYHLESIRRSLERILQTKMDMGRVLNSFQVDHRGLLHRWADIADLAKATEISVGRNLTESHLSSIHAVSRSMMLPESQLGQLQEMDTLIRRLAQIENTKIHQMSLATQHMMATLLVPNDIGQSLKLSYRTRKSLIVSFTKLTDRYVQFMTAPSSTVNLQLSNEVLRLPVIEEFTATNLLTAISEDEEDSDAMTIWETIRVDIHDETAVGLEALLTRLDPTFTRMWQGAVHALQTNGPDSGRHVLISLRELFDHVLRYLAPDEEVLQFVSAKELHNGKPTRSARLRYIYRHIEEDALSDFIRQDVKAYQAFFGILHRVHERSVSLKDSHLWALVLRAEALLRFLLQLADLRSPV